LEDVLPARDTDRTRVAARRLFVVEKFGDAGRVAERLDTAGD